MTNVMSLLAPATGTCPPWCAYPEQCRQPRLDEDREHRSATCDVERTREPLVDDIHADLTVYQRLQRVGAILVQHEDAPEAHVVVNHGDAIWERYELTLNEAEQFARGILDLVTAARQRAGQPGSRRRWPLRSGRSIIR